MSILKLFVQWLVTTVALGAVLFGAAGRLDLPMFWLYLGAYALLVLVYALVMSRRDPALLAERRRSGPGAKRWDRAWLAVYTALFVVTWVLAGLDAGRVHWSDTVPLWLQVVAQIVCVAAFALVWWASWANTFFSQVVRIQEERGHRVVTEGPYQYVRHPGYAANIVVWPASALALGSWWAMVPAGAIVAAFIVRTALEDRTLHRELEGYEAYAQRVRYRLLPGVW
jgi:protein-S-isoprenylcysteine O-methyltransferase Ste14